VYLAFRSVNVCFILTTENQKTHLFPGEKILVEKGDHADVLKWSCCNKFEHDEGCVKTTHNSVGVDWFSLPAAKQRRVTPSAFSPDLGASEIELDVLANGDHAKENAYVETLHEFRSEDIEHLERDSDIENPPIPEAKPELEEAEETSEAETEESDDYEAEEPEEQCVNCQKFYIPEDHKSYLSSEYCAWHEGTIFVSYLKYNYQS
jgi:hypothetical protein